MIIDHHLDDEFTIDADYKYIDVAASSASEIVTRVLKKMNIDYSLKLANALLAGLFWIQNGFKRILLYLLFKQPRSCASGVRIMKR